jgi:hypothetical protein
LQLPLLSSGGVAQQLEAFAAGEIEAHLNLIAQAHVGFSIE